MHINNGVNAQVKKTINMSKKEFKEKFEKQWHRQVKKKKEIK